MRSLLVFVFLVLLFNISLSVGGSDLGFTEFFRWLTHQPLEETQKYIFENLRFPRTMTAISVGAALAMAGLFLQALLDNPLAEPYTLGLSGGSTLGALSALLLGLEPSSLTLPLGGVLGAALVTYLIIRVIRASNAFRSRALILIGIMISLFCGSLVVLLISLLDPQKLHTAIHWMMGHCGTTRDLWWPGPFTAVLLAAVWALFRSRDLDSLLLGEELAISTGTDLKHLRIEIVAVVAILTSLSVALMGLVGFVGLLAPHISNSLSHSRRMNQNFFFTAATGAALLLSADILGRIIGGEKEIPAGSLVALIGAPFLAVLLLKRFKDV